MIKHPLLAVERVSHALDLITGSSRGKASELLYPLFELSIDVSLLDFVHFGWCPKPPLDHGSFSLPFIASQCVRHKTEIDFLELLFESVGPVPELKAGLGSEITVDSVACVVQLVLKTAASRFGLVEWCQG